MSIEYDGPGPLKSRDQLIDPISSFDQKMVRWLSFFKSSKPSEDLLTALTQHDPVKVRNLVLQGVNLDSKAYEKAGITSPMEYAITHQGEFFTSAISLFLSVGANPNFAVTLDNLPTHPVIAGFSSGQWDGAKLILNHPKLNKRPEPRSDGFGLIMAILTSRETVLYSRPGYQELLHWALCHSGSVNECLTQPLSRIKAYAGATPLILAPSCFDSAIALDFLIANHANLDAKDERGMNALMIACGRNDPDPVMRLLAAGASSKELNSKGEDALTCLFKSRFYGGEFFPLSWSSQDIIKRLIKAGLPAVNYSRLSLVNVDLDAATQQRSDGTSYLPAWIGQLRALEEKQTLQTSLVSMTPPPPSNKEETNVKRIAPARSMRI